MAGGVVRSSRQREWKPPARAPDRQPHAAGRRRTERHGCPSHALQLSGAGRGRRHERGQHRGERADAQRGQHRIGRGRDGECGVDARRRGRRTQGGRRAGHRARGQSHALQRGDGPGERDLYERHHDLGGGVVRSEGRRERDSPARAEHRQPHTAGQRPIEHFECPAGVLQLPGAGRGRRHERGQHRGKRADAQRGEHRGGRGRDDHCGADARRGGRGRHAQGGRRTGHRAGGDDRPFQCGDGSGERDLYERRYDLGGGVVRSRRHRRRNSPARARHRQPHAAGQRATGHHVRPADVLQLSSPSRRSGRGRGRHRGERADAERGEHRGGRGRDDQCGTHARRGGRGRHAQGGRRADHCAGGDDRPLRYGNGSGKRVLPAWQHDCRRCVVRSRRHRRRNSPARARHRQPHAAGRRTTEPRECADRGLPLSGAGG